jgi:hypothetical protein
MPSIHALKKAIKIAATLEEQQVIAPDTFAKQHGLALPAGGSRDFVGVPRGIHSALNNALQGQEIDLSTGKLQNQTDVEAGRFDPFRHQREAIRKSRDTAQGRSGIAKGTKYWDPTSGIYLNDKGQQINSAGEAGRQFDVSDPNVLNKVAPVDISAQIAAAGPNAQLSMDRNTGRMYDANRVQAPEARALATRQFQEADRALDGIDPASKEMAAAGQAWLKARENKGLAEGQVRPVHPITKARQEARAKRDANPEQLAILANNYQRAGIPVPQDISGEDIRNQVAQNTGSTAAQAVQSQQSAANGVQTAPEANAPQSAVSQVSANPGTNPGIGNQGIGSGNMTGGMPKKPITGPGSVAGTGKPPVMPKAPVSTKVPKIAGDAPTPGKAPIGKPATPAPVAGIPPAKPAIKTTPVKTETPAQQSNNATMGFQDFIKNFAPLLGMFSKGNPGQSAQAQQQASAQNQQVVPELANMQIPPSNMVGSNANQEAFDRAAQIKLPSGQKLIEQWNTK